MTPKQKVFADEYIRTRNGGQSYLKAYPTCKNAMVASACATRLLKKDNISAYIREQLDNIHDETIADAAEIMRYYTSVMRGEAVEEQLSTAGDVVKVAAKTSDRTQAAEKLAKMLGVDKDLERRKVEIERERLELEKKRQTEISTEDAPRIVFAEDGGLYAE